MVGNLTIKNKFIVPHILGVTQLRGYAVTRMLLYNQLYPQVTAILARLKQHPFSSNMTKS